MPHAAVSDPVWGRAVAEWPNRVLDDALLVVRGPLATLSVARHAEPPTAADALWLSLGVLLVVSIVGGGFSAAIGRALGLDAIEAVGWAPVIGVGVLVLVCVPIAASGLSPSSAFGLIAIGLVAAAGYAAAVLGFRRRIPEAPSVSVPSPSPDPPR
jgi:hypothetical protein